jgi:hypothetical protein
MNQNNIDVNKFNDFLDSANQTLSCDSNCQEKKKISELKKKYLESKTNLLTAPNQVESSYKNYLTYTQGDSAYNEYLDNKLAEKADNIINIFQSNFSEAIKKAIESYDTYSGLLLNFSHVVELYTNLLKENVLLELEVKNKTSDVLTNDRKTYYEDQSIESLHFYYIVLMIIYIIFLLGFAVSIFMFPSTSSKSSLVAILVFFVIYPFICIRIFKFFIEIYNKITGVLPTNVYKDI